MDPTIALTALRQLIADLRRQLDSDNPDCATVMQHASDVIDVFDGLDQWLAKDGCLPRQWRAPF